MAKYAPRPINPAFRPIARLIIDYLKREGISQKELARRVGAAPKSHAIVNPWIKARSLPAAKFREPLAKLIGCDPRDLMRPEQRASYAAPAKLGPVRQALTRVEAAPTFTAPTFRAQHAANALSYQGNGDGTATVLLRARLPVDIAKPLFRTLMDTNIDQLDPNQTSEERADD